MQQIIEEYGSAILGMVCVLMVLALVGMIVFGEGSPLIHHISQFADSIN